MLILSGADSVEVYRSTRGGNTRAREWEEVVQSSSRAQSGRGPCSRENNLKWSSMLDG